MTMTAAQIESALSREFATLEFARSEFPMLTTWGVRDESVGVHSLGFTVKTVNIEQQKYIGTALVGAFQWFQWRNHGGFDPDQQRVWWHSELATRDAAGKFVFDGKTIAINFNRIVDPTIDAAFDLIRTNSDPAVRKKAAENVNGAFADNAYDLWRWRTTWGVGQ